MARASSHSRRIAPLRKFASEPLAHALLIRSVPSSRGLVTAFVFVGSILSGFAHEAQAQSPCVTGPVHIASNRPVLLQLRDGTRRYRTLCAAPCDVAVPLGATYRIAGEGVRPSEDFVLDATCGAPIRLEVEAHARGTFIAGMVMLSVGGATFASAFLFLMVAGIGDEVGASKDGARSERLALGFGVMLGVGASLIATGLPVMLANRRSRVMSPSEETESKNGGVAGARARDSLESALVDPWTPSAPLVVTPISISF